MYPAHRLEYLSQDWRQHRLLSQISNIILCITVEELNEIKQITPPNVTVRRCFCVMGESGAKSYGEWSCGKKAIGFVEQRLSWKAFK